MRDRTPRITQSAGKAPPRPSRYGVPTHHRSGPDLGGELLAPPARRGSPLPRLTIGPPGDAAERAADAFADSWSRGAAPLDARAASAAPVASGAPAPAAVQATLTTPGEPLSEENRARFEPPLGDLGHVRVHSGPAADAAARAVGAEAFAVGSRVVLPAGQRARSSSHAWLLAHELAHVARGAPASVIRRAGPDEPSEAEQRQDFWMPDDLEGQDLETRAAWVRAASETYVFFGFDATIHAVFADAAERGDLYALQRLLDMDTLAGQLEDWTLVLLSALGPLRVDPEILNAARMRVIRDSAAQDPLHAQVFALYVLENATTDHVDDVLRRLAEDNRYSDTIGQMPAVQEAILARGLDPDSYVDRPEVLSDVGRGLVGVLGDIASTIPLEQDRLARQYLSRTLSMPQEYQDAYHDATRAAIDGMTAGDLVFGLVDDAALGVPGAAVGTVKGVFGGAGALIEGEYDSATRQLVPAALAVGALLYGVRVLRKGAASKSTATVGTLEEALAQLAPESAGLLRGLIVRLTPEGVVRVAGYVRANSKAAEFAAAHGEAGLLALDAAAGDVAAATKVLQKRAAALADAPFFRKASTRIAKSEEFRRAYTRAESLRRYLDDTLALRAHELPADFVRKARAALAEADQQLKASVGDYKGVWKSVEKAGEEGAPRSVQNLVDELESGPLASMKELRAAPDWGSALLTEDAAVTAGGIIVYDQSVAMRAAADRALHGLAFRDQPLQYLGSMKRLLRGPPKAEVPLDPILSDVDMYVVDKAAFAELRGLDPGLDDKGRIFVDEAARRLPANPTVQDLVALQKRAVERLADEGKTLSPPTSFDQSGIVLREREP
jgi:hypothetical protein